MPELPPALPAPAVGSLPFSSSFPASSLIIAELLPELPTLLPALSAPLVAGKLRLENWEPRAGWEDWFRHAHYWRGLITSGSAAELPPVLPALSIGSFPFSELPPFAKPTWPAIAGDDQGAGVSLPVAALNSMALGPQSEEWMPSRDGWTNWLRHDMQGLGDMPSLLTSVSSLPIERAPLAGWMALPQLPQLRGAPDVFAASILSVSSFVSVPQRRDLGDLADVLLDEMPVTIPLPAAAEPVSISATMATPPAVPLAPVDLPPSVPPPNVLQMATSEEDPLVIFHAPELIAADVVIDPTIEPWAFGLSAASLGQIMAVGMLSVAPSVVVSLPPVESLPQVAASVPSFASLPSIYLPKLSIMSMGSLSLMLFRLTKNVRKVLIGQTQKPPDPCCDQFINYTILFKDRNNMFVLHV